MVGWGVSMFEKKKIQVRLHEGSLTRRLSEVQTKDQGTQFRFASAA